MDAQTFLENFATVADAPGGAKRLRELVLNLAFRGLVVEQDPDEEAAAVLIDGMTARRDALIASGVIGKPRHPEGVAVDNPPHEIPAAWAWARLGDVSAIVGGGTPKSGESAYWADGPDVPWLTPADMRSQASRFVSRGVRDITKRGLAESSAQLLPAGAVLFSSRAPIGHVGIAAQPLSTNQGFKSCVPYLGAMAEYLYLLLRYVGPIVDATATGTTFKEVSGKDVALIPVPVPPMAEQERIAANVDELMALCDELETRQEHRRFATSRFRGSALHALTETDTPDGLREAWERISTNWPALTRSIDSIPALRQTILQMGVAGWLVGAGERQFAGLSAQGRDGAPPSDPRRLPAGWQLSTLKETCMTQTGATPSGRHTGEPHELISYVTPAQLGSLTVDESNLIPSSNAIRIAPRDSILFVGIGGSIGKCALTSTETTFNQQIHSASPDDLLLSSSFAAYILASPWFQARAKEMTSSTAIPIINKSRWNSIPIPLPPRDLQDVIVRRVESLLKVCHALEVRLERQAALHESLADSIPSGVSL